jgi:FkbM family methyltransferase
MEDYHLSLAFAGQEHGTYIDVGGGHPIAGSVTFWFYKRGWEGLVVEPQENLALVHRKLRPRDSLVQSLVGRENGETDFFMFDRLHGLSTTVSDYAMAAKEPFRTSRLKSMSLAELCRSHGRETIDFLKIDVEGAEGDVIAGGDWDSFRPGIVVVEAIAPISGEPTWDKWEKLLLAKGYRFKLFDSLNRFYVSEERDDLLAEMPTERAPWNAVLHMYEVGRAPENEAHPDHMLARYLERGFWASLPFLEEDVLTAVLRRGLELNGLQTEAAKLDVSSETFRSSLGLIASGYDGGFVDD